jgi:hypothetical protein
MIVLRKLVGGFMAVLAVLLVCVAVFEMVPFGGGVQHTVANAREIEKAFGAAAAFADGFIQSNGRLPTEPEFLAWAVTQPESVHSARTFQFLTSPSQFPPEVVQRFGRPVPNSYLLQYWRGEWFEYYASWAKASTLELDPKSFYLLGSPIADGTALLALAILIAAVAKGVWPPPNPSLHRTCAKSRAGR